MKYTPGTKKSLGQHWLHDTASLEAVAEAAEIAVGDVVLEVGPGLGTLTEVLLRHGALVTAVEFDHDLAEDLPRRLQHPDLEVIEEDILQFDLTQLALGYKVAANIPYYLTSHLVRVLCESTNPFSVAALLVQKEVAERLAAQPGQMSLLSVSTQFYCEVTLAKVVPAELFTPPPKVDSQIVRLRYRPEPLFSDVEPDKFFRIVKAGFAGRRKKLRSSLSAGLHIAKPEAEAMLMAAKIDPGLRAQALSLEDWHRLYQANINH